MTINRFITPVKRNGAGKEDRNKLSIIILDSLPGVKMKSYGPKCLLKLDGKNTILSHQVKILKDCYPYSEIIVSVGFEADKIIKSGISGCRFVENQLYEQTNVIEELRLALNNIQYDNVLLIHGDLVFSKKAIDNLTKDGSCLLGSSLSKFPDDELGITVDNNNYASIIAYGTPIKWGYVAYLCGQELLTFKNLCRDRNKNNLFCHEVINQLLERHTKIKVIDNINLDIIKIETIRDIKKCG